MSISLDLALYLREQKTHEPLTLSERGVLFTLFFRVGSNPFTWISQSTLSVELDVCMRQLKRQMKSLVEKGYIEVLKDPKDKRNNLYRPADFLINYHQQNNRKQTKKYVTKMSPNSENRGHKCHLNRGHKCHPLSEEKNSTELVTIDLQENDISPKATIESNIDIKVYNPPTPLKGDLVDIPLWLDFEDWKDFLEHRKSMKAPMSIIAQKRAIKELEKLKDQGEIVRDIINQSIVNGWKGLFKTRRASYGNDEKRLTRAQQELRDAHLLLDKFATRPKDTRPNHEIVQDLFS